MIRRNHPTTRLPRVEPVTRSRHYGGFLLAGLAALATDAAILTLFTDVVGASPYLARLFSIMIAMVVSWQLNRRITFATVSYTHLTLPTICFKCRTRWAPDH